MQTDTYLGFLLQIDEADLRTLIACIRDKMDRPKILSRLAKVSHISEIDRMKRNRLNPREGGSRWGDIKKGLMKRFSQGCFNKFQECHPSGMGRIYRLKNLTTAYQAQYSVRKPQASPYSRTSTRSLYLASWFIEGRARSPQARVIRYVKKKRADQELLDLCNGGRKERTNYFFKKESRRFICCENILTISPAKANMTQNFQKMNELDSRSIERNSIDETKKSRIACMAIP